MGQHLGATVIGAIGWVLEPFALQISPLMEELVICCIRHKVEEKERERERERECVCERERCERERREREMKGYEPFDSRLTGS